MNTGTYYVFEYNGTRQLRNLGFFKITCRPRIYQLHLCIRGITVSRNDTLPLYAFYLTEKSTNAFLIENIPCEDHSISTKTEIPLSHFPEDFTLDKIDGFFLMLPDQTVLAAHDNALTFDSHAIQFVTESETPIEESSEEPAEALSEEPLDNSQNPPPDIRKIQRKDLACLPRRYWNLANNSFLLHGYHNYNHLLLVEEDGHYILGVPGIKDKYETQVAKMFGFRFFSTDYVSILPLTSDEKESDDNFGYWCCNIPRE